MKPLYLFLLLLTAAPAVAQHTFSIVAVDTLTGEIGSAGASCLDNVQFPGSGGARIISDIIPGRGAIHTQAAYNPVNQANARQRMLDGLSPTQVVDWLKTNDAQGGFAFQSRQYGVVDFDPTGQPRSAAFTGTTAMNWKGHRTGATYAIQGNILLGPQILDSMEARFLATPGPLADRLMAALQGANVVGADTRCTDNGTSSLSAFLRLARPDDDPDSLYLDLNVPALPAMQEPIDSLQTLYDAWLLTQSAGAPASAAIRLFPNPAAGFFHLVVDADGAHLAVYAADGRLVVTKPLQRGANTMAAPVAPGLYLLRITTAAGGNSWKRMVVRE